jgi:hypothetical protein
VVSTARSSETVRVDNPPEPRTVYAGAPVIAPPPQTIVIESSQPDRVYVPAYNPAVVYGPPVPVYPGYAYRPPSPVANEVVVGALSLAWACSSAKPSATTVTGAGMTGACTGAAVAAIGRPATGSVRPWCTRTPLMCRTPPR